MENESKRGWECNLTPEEALAMLKRNQEIVKSVLLPFTTLQEIGDQWGLTRERVRQIIFKATDGGSYSAIKKSLREAIDNFRCLSCGKPLKDRDHKRYCSKNCYRFICQYDLDHPVECRYCHQLFFRFRNVTNESVIKRCHGGSFCCMAHYLNFKLEHSKKFSKEGLIKMLHSFDLKQTKQVDLKGGEKINEK
jgi:hypothetical protein